MSNVIDATNRFYRQGPTVECDKYGPLDRELDPEVRECFWMADCSPNRVIDGRTVREILAERNYE